MKYVVRGEGGRYLGSSEASSVDWVTRAEAEEMDKAEAEREAAGFAGAEVEEAVEEGRGDGQGVCVRGVQASASCGDDVSLAADARARVGGDVPPAAGRRLGEEGAVGRVEGERAVEAEARPNEAPPDFVKAATAFIDEWLPGDEEIVGPLAEELHDAFNAGHRAGTRTANPVHDVPKTDDGEPITVGDRLVSNHGIYKGRIMRVLEVDARDASCANIVVTPERDALANEHRIAVHGSFFTKVAHAEPDQGSATESQLADHLHPRGAACPCTLLETACRAQCTCRNPMLSGGCLCCATYGSVAQQMAAARRIFDAVTKSCSETAHPGSLRVGDRVRWAVHGSLKGEEAVVETLAVHVRWDDGTRAGPYMSTNFERVTEGEVGR